MPRSLSDLRANPPKSRPERSIDVSFRADLVAEVEQLEKERAYLPPAPPRGDEDGGGSAKLTLSPQERRGREITKRLVELRGEIAENIGTLTVRALPEAQWREWVDKHPAREKDQKGHARDLDVAGGWCNADALIDALGTFAYKWNGEILSADDWPMFAEGMLGPDKKEAARKVVMMHEQSVDFTNWLTLLPDNLSDYDDSEPPETSASAPGSSTDGPTSAPSAATTETDSK